MRTTVRLLPVQILKALVCFSMEVKTSMVLARGWIYEILGLRDFANLIVLTVCSNYCSLFEHLIQHSWSSVCPCLQHKGRLLMHNEPSEILWLCVIHIMAQKWVVKGIGPIENSFVQLILCIQYSRWVHKYRLNTGFGLDW